MTDYDIRYEPLFGTLETMNVQALIDAVQEPWYNQTLLQVGDVVVRLGVMQGEFHWHKHDEQDEFFFVLEGRLDIELEDRTVVLEPGKGFVVPRGVMHFPHARGRTVAMLVELAGVVPTGD